MNYVNFLKIDVFVPISSNSEEELIKVFEFYEILNFVSLLKKLCFRKKIEMLLSEYLE